VTALTVHRLLLGSLLLATKQWDDALYSNAVWAKVGGISKEQLNGIESALLVNLPSAPPPTPTQYSLQRTHDIAYTEHRVLVWFLCTIPAQLG
jgi:hypothetical protein